MKIFIISLANTYESWATQLESEGHTVKLYTQEDCFDLYLGNSNVESRVYEALADFEPDYVVNNIPALHLQTQYTCLGNSLNSARLETHKWEARQKAVSVGFKVPEVLEECSMNNVSTSYTDTVFLKSKVYLAQCTYKIPAGTNIANHNANLPDYPAYVEKDIEHEIEAHCCFTVANGDYCMWRICGYTGTGEAKVQFAESDWFEHASFVDLSEENFVLFSELAHKWASYVATLGGNYQASMSAGIKNGEVYFYEQNSRRGTGETFTGVGTDWLNSLTTNPHEAMKCSWSINNVY